MKEILLTQGKVAFVDDEEFERLNAVRWCAHKSYNTFYAERGIYNSLTGKIKHVKMHLEIMGCPPKGSVCDHGDGNGLNNQKNNLHFVSQRQNSQNRHSHRSSRFPGVSYEKRTNKWRSRIWTEEGRERWLGYFDTEEMAFSAYEKALKEMGVQCIKQHQDLFPRPLKELSSTPLITLETNQTETFSPEKSLGPLFDWSIKFSRMKLGRSTKRQ